MDLYAIWISQQPVTFSWFRRGTCRLQGKFWHRRGFRQSTLALVVSMPRLSVVDERTFPTHWLISILIVNAPSRDRLVSASPAYLAADLSRKEAPIAGGVTIPLCATPARIGMSTGEFDIFEYAPGLLQLASWKNARRQFTLELTMTVCLFSG